MRIIGSPIATEILRLTGSRQAMASPIHDARLTARILSSYRRAGADILLADSFMISSLPADERAAQAAAVVASAFRAAEGAQVWAPIAPPVPGESSEHYAQSLSLLRGADTVWIQTIWHSGQPESLLKAVALLPDDMPPIAVSLALADKAVAREAAAAVLESGMKLRAFGFNCFPASDENLRFIAEILERSPYPKVLLPSGPSPDWEKVLKLRPDYVGGCCGCLPGDLRLLIATYRNDI